MKTLRVQALKPHKYGTRHLTAGEEYELPIREAVALMATKKAKAIKPEKRSASAEPQTEPEAPSLDSLRLQATQLGIDVDGRWGVHRLQQEIAERQR